ncbi:glutathione S-transferase family protein [Hoeflea prorocentri]|uniref:Glutathione S-transferase family protein n=1 Tax=Hoeflea prorocentri TaxID=1922333 RepID=A0A9X3ZGU1_9HYPH|nr:glutathione S-transferase family protein [Hoeflea prorocentri]MCY6380100.1 glutathione S-transferase family protein [Hoeflea prorocentri]MDA5397900.1 glutathione S-transferase family protein [Hoeflea prorocentri]
MKLLYSPPSPYSAKVRMAAHYVGIDTRSESVDTTADPAELVSNNPLGKIPTLINGETAVYDSRAIMQFIDRESGKKLYPRNAQKRTEAEVLEALCDGVTDCLLAIMYERRFRPEEKVHQPWIDRQWSKVERSLDHLNESLPRTTKKLHGGHFALAALLGYLSLRFEGKWERGRPKLKNWPAKFARFFPEYDQFKPNAP